MKVKRFGLANPLYGSAGLEKKTRLLLLFLFNILFTAELAAQPTGFTYQGSLQDNGVSADANYDFQFALFDQLAAGAQVGTTLTRSNIPVTEGIFTVELDFGNLFPGADRFLEIRVRPAGGGAYTTLAPRQQIASVPYAVRSLSAETAVAFSGELNGDVTGPQGTTSVERIRGRTVSETTPLNDQVLRFDSATNRWVPETLATPIGDITGVTAGTGLFGGGDAGTVMLSVANGGIGTGQIANSSVTDAKIVSVGGGKVTGTVAAATNAAQLGGVAANQYVLTGDPRLSDARNPLPGSGNYVQNRTTQQASANFNISGTGTATVFDALEQYDISGTRMLFANGLYTDPDFGAPLTNVFIGYVAGNSNVPDPNNASVSGKFNTFVGTFAGANTTSGRNNAFFGDRSGFANTTGLGNTFTGSAAGSGNSGSQNVAFGYLAGSGNSTGNNLAAFGYLTRFGSGNLSNAVAIGARAQVNCSNCMTLGSIDGINGANANTNVGIGTTAPTNILTVVGAGVSTGGVGSSNEVVARFRQTSGANHLGVSIDALAGTDPILYLAENGSAVWDIRNDAGNDTFQVRHQIGGANMTRFSISTTGAASVNGTLAVSTLGSAGATALCRNASNQVSTCSSSIRYKSDIADFASGLDLIERLRPVAFMWKDGGAPDLGLIAEEVADVEPLLTTLNLDGETEGVKYDRLGVVLVNAVKEQQREIDAKQREIDRQKQLIARQQAEIDQLKTRQDVFEAEIRALLCSSGPDAGVCQGEVGR